MDEAGLNFIPADLTIEDNGKAIPFRETPFVKDSPDFATLLKRGYDSHRALGGAIRPPSKDAKPEEIKAFQEKIFATGHVPKPPQIPDNPDKYEVVMPEKLPKGVVWRDDLAGKAKEFFHKNGFTAEQAKAAVAFQAQMLGEMTAPTLAEYETGMEAIKKEWGTEFDAKAERAGRVAAALFSDDPEAAKIITETGMGNHPSFLKLMDKLYDYVKQDDGFLERGGSQGMDADMQEAQRLMAILNDSKHPDYHKVLADPQTNEKINAAFKKAHPGEYVIS